MTTFSVPFFPHAATGCSILTPCLILGVHYSSFIDTPAQLAAAADFWTPDIRFQAFSDTSIAYATLTTAAKQRSLSPLVRFMHASVIAVLNSLGRGHAIRGAIDVGFGMGFPTEFYGPALLSVYELESKCAGWPRILVGEGVVDLWNTLATAPILDKIDEANARFATYSRALCFTDVDGALALDFLGPNLTIEFKNQMEPFAEIAYYQAERLKRRYCADDKIRHKYDRLLDYFRIRIGEMDDTRRAAAEAMFLKRQQAG